MREITIHVEEATPQAVAAYGHFVGATGDEGVFTRWPGTTVYGATPMEIESRGEVLMVQMDARSFPLQVGIIERHFHHTQAYLSANGRPFVMVLGLETEDRVPVLERLRAFRFSEGAGIVLHKEVWHDFPYAIENNTRFVALLSAEAHVNTLENPRYPMEAEGPDLERRSIRARATVMVDVSPPMAIVSLSNPSAEPPRSPSPEGLS